jgi:hypothetical protein
LKKENEKQSPLGKKKSGSALLSRDGQMFFRSKKSLFDFAPEGYLTPSGWALKLDSKEKRKRAPNAEGKCSSDEKYLSFRRRKVIFGKALRAELDNKEKRKRRVLKVNEQTKR